MIEILTFALAAGPSDVDVFVAADARVQTEFAYRQPGLVRRTTARSDDGRWLVLTLWGSAEDADRAAAAAAADPAVAALESLVDQANKRTERFSALD